MLRSLSRAICAGILAIAALAGAASAGTLGSVDVPRITAPPPIDGTLTNAAWKQAAVVHLAYNLRDHGPAPDSTTAYIMSDGTYLYVGFEARQHTAVRAVQHTNNVGADTDDEVQIDLFPNGSSGFHYAFFCTALGTHYQFGSENNAYEPTWWSAGKLVPGGFTATMKIPLNVMHGTGTANWHVQFARLVMSTNDDLVWSFGTSQSNHNDVNYAGVASGLPQLGALKAQPRIGVYGLGAVAAPRAGGTTSRSGVDLSIPIIQGTSFVATLHPDFSNVETDQQTIAPTAFARFLNDTRPFFTQGANFYSTTPNCTDCPGTQLYTLAIPTPRDGYALEGQRGLFTYATFDAVGYGRNDSAQALTYTSPNQKTLFTVQRGSFDTRSAKDDTVNVSLTHDNLKNFSTWIRYANDSGTFVQDGARAQRYEGGFNYYSPTSSLQAELRKVGEFFNPVDGLIFHPDIAGYVVNGFKQFNFPAKSALREITLNADIQRYHGHTGGMNQSVSQLFASVTTRSQWNVQGSIGSSYLTLDPGPPALPVFMPINQQELQVTYDYGSATPTRLTFQTGRFGPGHLNSWGRSSTLRMGERGSLLLEADNTDQRLDNGKRYVQWLERAGFAYQTGSDSSLALGVRRIIGYSPYLTQTSFSSGWNVTAAYHRRTPLGEMYLAYGDASAFSTVPQFIIKLIQYVGGGKGT